MIETVKQNVSEHVWVLAVFLGAGGWMVYRMTTVIMETRRRAKEFVAHVIDERLPTMIKAVLANGITDLMVRLNQDQDRKWHESMTAAFREHESREKEQVESAVDDARKDTHLQCERVLKRLDEHDQKLGHLERKITAKRRR